MEGKEPTITELINKIELLKQALLFYSDYDHYKKTNQNNETSMVEHDEGHQARFVLDQIKDIDEYNNKLIEESKNYINLIKKFREESDNKEDVIADLKLMKKLIEQKNNGTIED